MSPGSRAPLSSIRAVRPACRITGALAFTAMVAAAVPGLAGTASPAGSPGAAPSTALGPPGGGVFAGAPPSTGPHPRAAVVVKIRAGSDSSAVAFLPRRASAVAGLRASEARWLLPRAGGDSLDRRGDGGGAIARAVAARGLDRVAVVPLALGTDAPAAAAALAALPEVEYAEPVVSYSASALTNDPYLHSAGAWGQSHADLWGLHRIGAPAAWDAATGAGVVVAVIDSGCDGEHPDLAGNLWANPGEVPGNGLDDDGNGYADDARGWDFVVGDADPQDRYGHGTHVAGTVAAVGNNAQGVVGVAWRARVMALKGLDDFGFGWSDQLAEAILYAAAQGADVINMSWGGLGQSQVIEDALGVAHDLGTVLIAAAGNANSPTEQFHPAGSRWVIAVGASQPEDRRASFSNHGPGTDLLAPGGGTGQGIEAANVLSLRSAPIEGDLAAPELAVGNGYLRLAGTSMAAPHVAGVAALLRQRFPGAGTETVRQLLRTSALDLETPGWDIETAYGRLDAAAATRAPALGEARVLGPRPAVIAGEEVEVTAVASTPVPTEWRLEFGPGELPPSWSEVSRGTTDSGGEARPLATWAVAEVPDGVYTLRLLVPLPGGIELEDRLRITLDRVAIEGPPRNWAFRGGDPLVLAGRTGGGGFARFRVEHRPAGDPEQEAPWSDDGVSLTAGGSAPVLGGTLATWDTTGVPAGYYELRLVVERSGLPEVEERVQWAVDPTLHPGWPQSLGIAEGLHLALTDHLTAADLDRDGAAELLVAYGPEVRVYRGDGSPMPGWPQRVDDLPFVAVQTGPTAADLDGDGDLEVIAGSGANQLFIWEHDGRRVAPWPLPYGRTAAVADLDLDGVGELITTFFFEGPLRVFSRDGTIAWERFPSAGELTPPAIGDVAGDLRPEIALAATGDRISLFLFDADGGTPPGWPVDLGPSGPLVFLRRHAQPALGDLDGDGEHELVAIDGDCRVHVLDGDGSPLPGWPQPFGSQPYDCNSPTVGDLDGDGSLEVAIGGREQIDGFTLGPSRLAVWRADGTALPGFPVEVPTGSGLNTGFHGFGPAALADLDGDGLPDLAADRSAVFPTPWALEAFRADGSRVPGFPKPVSGGSDWPTNIPAVADLDGDGLAELAWISDRGDIYVWDLPAAARPADWPMHRGGPAQLGARPLALEAVPCLEDATTLCLQAGRFGVKASWRDFQGHSGVGRALPQTADTGALWFFNLENVELLVKVLDGRPVNDRFWVFFASLSNVEFDVRVTDGETGRVRRYRNPSRTFASQADIGAFPAAMAATAPDTAPPAPPSAAPRNPPAASGALPAGSGMDSTDVLLRDGRFQVSVAWEDGRGGAGPGQGHRLTRDTAALWFFRPGNLELAVKVLDGRPVNGRFWLFYASLSNVGFRLRATDLATGQTREYVNPRGRLASRGDTEGFSP